MKQFLSFFLLVLLVLIVNNSFSQAIYVKPNEINLLSFNTVNGKKVSVVIDTIKRYIMYRYGTSDNIELEYPKDTSQSYKLFRWYYNFCDTKVCASADYYSIYFINGDYSYKIYRVFHDNDGYNTCVFGESGLVVTENLTNKEFKIRGIDYTEKDNLLLLQSLHGLLRSDDPF